VDLASFEQYLGAEFEVEELQAADAATAPPAGMQGSIGRKSAPIVPHIGFISGTNSN
jgi:hypothetical protein